MATTSDTHPMIRYAKRHGLSQAEAAAFFGIPYGSFRQLVNGWIGCSLGRAESIAEKSGGSIRVLDLLRWHDRNRRHGDGGEAAA